MGTRGGGWRGDQFTFGLEIRISDFEFRIRNPNPAIEGTVTFLKERGVNLWNG